MHIFSQIISLIEQEKATLQEKNAVLVNDLSQANSEFECLKREAQGQHEQNRAIIISLQGELKNFRAQFEETM